MGSLHVSSLSGDDLTVFLDRRRYSAFSMPRPQLDAFLRDILVKANEFVPAEAGSILMDQPRDRGETPALTKLFFVAVFGSSCDDLIGASLQADQ